MITVRLYNNVQYCIIIKLLGKVFTDMSNNMEVAKGQYLKSAGKNGRQYKFSTISNGTF